MSSIEYNDTSHAIYDIHNKQYWDEQSMWQEAQRSFEICEGCRLCFKYCSTFPSMFDLIGETEGNSISQVKLKDLDQPVNECFQCKLCYVKCPYTDRDEHAYNLNLPALFTRWRAIRHKTRFSLKSIRDYVLSNPKLIGVVGGWMPFLVNFLNKNVINRFFMDLTLNIHRRKSLPKVYWTSFLKRFKKTNQTLLPNNTAQEEVVLFPTCFVNWNAPHIGEDALFVLNQNGKKVICNTGDCCGAPQLDRPNFKKAAQWARKIINKYSREIEEGVPILALNPTCSMTMRSEYPKLFSDPEEKAKAQKFASLVRDFSEHLWEEKQNETLNREFKSSPGGIDYHAACHLRAQGIGFRSRDILRMIPDTQITFTDECSCHDGTFAFKKEFYDLSMRYGQNAFKSLSEKPNKLKATDCPLAAMQLQEGMGSEDLPSHPVQIMARAYREDGFSK